MIIDQELLKFKVRSKKLNGLSIDFYYIKNLKNRLNEKKISFIVNVLNNLTNISWGNFGNEFIRDHVISSKFLVLAVFNNELIGYAAVDDKVIFNKHYYYFEFLIIHPDYQDIGVGKELIKILFSKIILYNLFRCKLSLDLITITPSPRIIGMISRKSVSMYPDPKYFLNNKIKEANQETWGIASYVIKNSYNPNRVLDKVGLVLHNSYDHTPWLIYDPEHIQWDFDDRVNLFCKRYLEYDQRSGKEFLVIAKIRIY